MSTTTVHPAERSNDAAPEIEVSEFEAACLDEYALILLESAHDEADTPAGRARIRRLLSVMDDAARQVAKPANVLPFADFFRKEASYDSVEHDERELERLIATGDTSDFWPSQSLAYNIRTQRQNVEGSRRCRDEINACLAVVERCEIR